MCGVALELEIRKGESERQYIWRLHKFVNNGDMTWNELADAVNTHWREEEDEYFGESAYRKPVQQAEAYYLDVFSKMRSEGYSKELEEQKRELEQAKIQLRDERRAWQEQNASAARVTQKLDYLEECLSESGKVQFADIKPDWDISAKSMVVCLSDLHIGQTFDSCLGSYNTDIAKNRLEKYLREIHRIASTHGVSDCYLFCLGDQISGNIHKRISVTNRENVIKQLTTASELISSFCYELCQIFSRVSMASVGGNHSRLDKKDDALHDERLDDLVAWYVKNMLGHVQNFSYIENTLDSGIGSVNIKGREYLLVHGDYDTTDKHGVAALAGLAGYFPEAVFCGHKHFPAFADTGRVRVIQSGSLAGAGDDFTIEHRLTGRPSQTVCICSTGGIDCMYPVDLS